jgi:hypothetical protein
MALTLASLITPQSYSFWRVVLLQALQGVGNVVQSAPTTSYIQGTGTVNPSGPATQAASVVVLITTDGNLGSGAFEYSTDGGVTFSSPITIPSGATSSSGAYLIASIGVTLTFTIGTYISPGQTTYFVANEQYAFPTFVPNFPVSNWEPIAPSYGLIQADAQALADMSLTQAQVTAGGFTQSWINPPSFGPPPDGWLDLLSQNIYNRPRTQGTSTTGIVQLSNSGTAAQVISNGELIVATQSGQQFSNITSGTIPAKSGSTPGTLLLTVKASSVGSSFNNVPTWIPYTPPASNPNIPGGNYILTIVSPTLPGVSVTNPINSTPTCIHTGSGPASITFTGTATSAFNIIFLVTTSGALGTSTYSYSLDGGNTYTSAGVTTGSGFSYQGMSVSFPAGTYVSGDTYSFSTGWITTFGSDTESSLTLATADQNQWAQLAPSSPARTYSNWALAASPEVTKVFVTQSVTVPGQVNLLLVGQNNGPVSTAGVAAVQQYIQQRLGINDSVLTATVIQQSVAVTAPSNGIQIHSGQATSVYAGVAQALYKLQISIPPGGSAPDFAVTQSAVLAAILSVNGVIQVVNDLIDLNSLNQNYQLQPSWVPLLVPPPTSSYDLL